MLYFLTLAGELSC